MKSKKDIEVHDLVQICPEDQWGGMLLAVTEVYSWGVQGYVYSDVNFEAVRFKGRAYRRLKWDDFEIVGCFEWVKKEEESDDKEENEHTTV